MWTGNGRGGHSRMDLCGPDCYRIVEQHQEEKPEMSTNVPEFRITVIGEVIGWRYKMSWTDGDGVRRERTARGFRSRQGAMDHAERRADTIAREFTYTYTPFLPEV